MLMFRLSVQVCQDCSEDQFVTDYASGDIICRSCGLVSDSHIIDDRPESMLCESEVLTCSI